MRRSSYPLFTALGVKVVSTTMLVVLPLSAFSSITFQASLLPPNLATQQIAEDDAYVYLPLFQQQRTGADKSENVSKLLSLITPNLDSALTFIHLLGETPRSRLFVSHLLYTQTTSSFL